MKSLTLASLTLAGLVALAATPLAAAEFSFVALGDMPYGPREKSYAPYEALIAEVNAQDPALVIHVGDTKSGSSECSDMWLDEQLDYLNSFQSPVLYSPGDNEWVDCHRAKAGGYDPLERLAYLRKNYFADPATSLGAEPAPVQSQAAAGYPENARMMKGGVMFVTAHVPGSNNNFEPRSMDAIKEFMARAPATVTWLKDSFANAIEDGAAALVVAIQADMFRGGFDGGWPRQSGFKAFGEALKAEAVAFGKPVMLIYGDSHVFRQSRPFPMMAPNLMALEVPGSSQMHAVEVGVDTAAPGVFSVSFLANPALSN